RRAPTSAGTSRGRCWTTSNGPTATPSASASSTSSTPPVSAPGRTARTGTATRSPPAAGDHASRDDADGTGAFGAGGAGDERAGPGRRAGAVTGRVLLRHDGEPADRAAPPHRGRPGRLALGRRPPRH